MKLIFPVLLTIILSVCVFAQNVQQNSSQSADGQEATRLSQQVVTLFQQKKFSDALPLAKKVVEIREREFGKTHLSVAQAYLNLAYTQAQLDKQKESAANFENAFDIYEKNQPLSVADEKTYTQLLEITAINQAVSGDFDKAEKKMLRAIELQEKLYGKDDVTTANALSKFAEIYQAQGDYEKALPLLFRSLDIKINRLGVENDATENSFQSVSCTLNKLGRKDESDKLHDKLYPSKLSDDRPVIGGVINGKAIKLITPPYPVEAKSKRISGVVNVNVTIDETGKVIQACAVSGAKELQRTSEAAAYLSTFSPTTVNKKPVKVTGVIVYNFVAQ